MFQVDDKPVETLHIYVVREAAPKPSLLPIVLSVGCPLVAENVYCSGAGYTDGCAHLPGHDRARRLGHY